MSHKKDTKIEEITPVRFSRNDKHDTPGVSERPFFLKGILLAVALLSLIGGGVWFLGYLSENQSQPTLGTAAIAEKAPKIQDSSSNNAENEFSETPDPSRLAADIKEAERLFASFTLVKNELVHQGVSEWGGELYARMVQLSQEADTSFIEKDYLAAGEKYASATVTAHELSGQTEDVYRQMMVQGQVALEDGNGQVAQQKFRLALMLDPASEAAQHGLERALAAEEVRQFLDSGWEHEKKGNDSFAFADYQEALKRDPESKRVQDSLNRVKNRIKNNAFQQLMSEGLAAYHNNDYPLAKNKLMKAKSLEPASKEVRSALFQVDQAILLSRVESLQKTALKAEKAESWEQALEAYLEVLKIDNNIQFALQGKKRCDQQIQIEKRISFFLQNPGTLESDRQLENAKNLIHDINSLPANGPKLKSALAELNHLVALAQLPIEIIIESDNQTEVAIYRVGKLGRFDRRTLTLRPGTYIIVGARDGYQDIRHQIVIPPEQKALNISVICNVKL